MTTWILLFSIIVNNTGTTLHSQEFGSQSACQYAGQQLEEQINLNSGRNIPKPRIAYVCVAQDDPH